MLQSLAPFRLPKTLSLRLVRVTGSTLSLSTLMSKPTKVPRSTSFWSGVTVTEIEGSTSSMSTVALPEAGTELSSSSLTVAVTVSFSLVPPLPETYALKAHV